MPRQSYPRNAKTAAMKKIAAIYAYENTTPPEPAPIKTYQFPFTEEPNETHDELIARLRAQLKYYKEHPYIPKKPAIARFFSYLKKLIK
jgi:hypothetical protein